ncbi:MAG: DUF4340 domain-containing protein [Chthonomonadales bacterium]|nr:DUF4340 domain-containing protein [Chthonomonadales bacterium]
MRRLRDYSAWIAIAALAVLGAFLALDLRRPVREPGQSPKVSDLLDLKPADTRRIEIDGAGPPIALARQGGGWRLEQPVQGPADADAVKKILDGLLEQTTDYVMERPPRDLSGFGLAKPGLKVTLSGVGGRRRALEVGGEDPAKQAVYVREAASGRVFLLPSTGVADARAATPDSLRDRALIAVKPAEVTGITLARPSGTVAIERQGGAWRLTRPWQAPADGIAADSLRDSLASLRAERFVAAGAAGQARYGLARPRLVASVFDARGAHAVRVGARDPAGGGFYAAREGSEDVLLLAATTYDSLNKSASDLRSRRMLALKTEDARRVTVTTPKGSWEARREGEDWRMVRPSSGKKADSIGVEDVLFDLSADATRHIAENPPDRARYGLDAPAATVSVTLGDGSVKTLTVGARAGKSDYYAAGSDAPGAVFAIPDYVVDRLRKPPALAP